MVFESGSLDEREVGGEDVVDGFAIEHFHEQGDHAFGDYGIGVGEVVDLAVRAGGFEPDLRLATFDQAVRGMQVFGHRGELFAEADHVFVAFLPVLEEVEFVENLLLIVRNAHGGGIRCPAHR